MWHCADVGPTCWANVGPISKITLGQHQLPTLGQCNWFCWANVGPTQSCYLGCLSPVYMFPKLRADRNNPKSFFFHKIFHLYSFYRNTAILLCILLKGSFFTVNNFMRKKNPNRKDNSFKLINLTSTWSF